MLDEQALSQPANLTSRFQVATVTDVIAETFDTRSFVLALDHSWQHQPGQHIRIGVEIDGGRHERCYSLSNTPPIGAPQITVKRNPRSFVSAWLVANLKIGSRLEVSQPEGGFVLRRGTSELLFLAAGSGITPIASILRQALDEGRAAKLLHIDRTPADGIFRGEFRHLLSKYPQFEFHPWFTSLRGRPDNIIKEFIAAADADIYLCGPESFRARCVELLADAGIASSRVYQESFGAAAPHAATVNLSIRHPDGSCTALRGNVGATLLEALRDNAISHPSVCGGRAICGTCRVTVESIIATDLTPPERQEARLLAVLSNANSTHRLACQIRLTAAHEGACFAAAPVNRFNDARPNQERSSTCQI